jgi:hypothetical protein
MNQNDPTVVEWRASSQFFWIGLIGLIFFPAVLVYFHFYGLSHPDPTPQAQNRGDRFEIMAYGEVGLMMLGSGWLILVSRQAKLRISPDRIEYQPFSRLRTMNCADVEKVSWLFTRRKVILFGKGQRLAVDLGTFSEDDQGDIWEKLRTMFAGHESDS